MRTERASKWWRRKTARLRALPDFLVVGTQKGGTSSLFSYLAQHPRVVPARVKEVHFFDKKFARGELAYRQEFPLRATLAARRAITGEATPVYMFHPYAPERIAAWTPDVKLIFLLRDPVERAFSHYRMSFRRGVDTLPFPDAIAAEPGRIDGELEKLLDDPLYFSQPIKRFSYRVRGHYAEQIERWLQHFDREQMLVMQSERFFADPAAGHAEVVRFLGLPPHELADQTPKNVGQDVEMDAGTRAVLAEHYRPWNERLFALLGTRFDWQVPS